MPYGRYGSRFFVHVLYLKGWVTRMSDTKRKKNREMGMFRELLLKQRDELTNRIEQRRQEIVADQEPDDEVGLALRNSSAGMAIANIERDVRTLSEIDLCLRLMDKDEYGVCAMCGETIPTARLRAIPWTRRCITCAGGSARRGEGPSRLDPGLAFVP
jgi:DnaK suppressor protein